MGLIPTGWYPGAIAFDRARNQLCVANIKGIGSGKNFAPGEHVELSSHQFRGSVSIIPIPGKSKLANYTQIVFRNYGRAAIS